MRNGDRPTRVVLVDDSPVVRERLAAMLEEAGVEVVGQAKDASKGMEVIRQLAPDVVVLDMGLPDKSGVDLLEELQGEPRQPLVIMLTNDNGPGVRKQCLDAGASFFFHKASEFERVLDVLRD